MTTANNDLFSIHKITHEDGAIAATLGINQDSPILKGHFPGRPVVPGACMLQIIKEVLEEALTLSLLLKKADHLKFITMIDPAIIRSAQLDISYKYSNESIVATARLANADTVYFKFQGSFIEKLVTNR
jgi:3-hydroxyacyl-[acyl-carrier-protein] dehydratase